MDNNHIQALKTKKAALESAIEEEMARPLPDEVVLANLKRQKLKIKEEIISKQGDA